MPRVELQAFDPERDHSLVSAWLRRPHVSRWWGGPSQALAAVRTHPVEAEALILVDARPVGYLCWQMPTREELKAAGLADLPHDLVDVDIMISEPDAIGHSVGPEALRQLFARLKAQGVKLVGVAAAVSNRRALGAYAVVGLRPFRDFVEHNEQYRYFTKSLQDAT
jgi:RimJ/RimL family protein N-acetyltransferase